MIRLQELPLGIQADTAVIVEICQGVHRTGVLGIGSQGFGDLNGLQVVLEGFLIPALIRLTQRQTGDRLGPGIPVLKGVHLSAERVI